MFTWTTSMPGEIASGHAARLGRLNGATSHQGVCKVLHKHFKNFNKLPRSLPTIFYLALGNGGDFEHYVREHAWMTDHQATQRPKGIVKYSDRIFMSRKHKFGLGPSMQDGYSFCLRCAEEDLDILGFSYWRRIHQFSGIDVCSRHKKELLTIRLGDSRLSLPSEYLQGASPPDAELIASVIDHPVVSRYETIAAALLRRDSPICITAANNVLEWRCRELGFLPDRVSWQMALRNHIFGLAPPTWLSAHFTGCCRDDFNQKDNRCHAGKLDWEPNSAMEYALAFAALFDIVEEAITHLADPEAT